jgi:uncharacterized coiled-coil protein SlyX
MDLFPWRKTIRDLTNALTKSEKEVQRLNRRVDWLDAELKKCQSKAQELIQSAHLTEDMATRRANEMQTMLADEQRANVATIKKLKAQIAAQPVRGARGRFTKKDDQ